MSRAFQCDRCKTFITQTYNVDQTTVDKAGDNAIVVDLNVMRPQGFDICPKCGAEYIIEALNKLVAPQGGIATIVWKEVKKPEETKPPLKSPNIKDTTNKGDKNK